MNCTAVLGYKIRPDFRAMLGHKRQGSNDAPRIHRTSCKSRLVNDFEFQIMENGNQVEAERETCWHSLSPTWGR